MKNLENFGVQELKAFEMENINGGIDYIDFVSWPEGASGQSVGAGLFVAGANVLIGVANAGIAVANGVSALWSWATE
jgi:hypothetical protein